MNWLILYPLLRGLTNNGLVQLIYLLLFTLLTTIKKKKKHISFFNICCTRKRHYNRVLPFQFSTKEKESNISDNYWSYNEPIYLNWYLLLVITTITSWLLYPLANSRCQLYFIMFFKILKKFLIQYMKILLLEIKWKF